MPVLNPVRGPLGTWLLAASLVLGLSCECSAQDVTLGPEATAAAQSWASDWEVMMDDAEAKQGCPGCSEQMWGRASAGDMGKGIVLIGDICDILKSLTYVTGIRRQRYFRKWVEAIFKEIMAKNFPKLKKNLCSQIQEAQENYKLEEHKTYLGASKYSC